MTAGALRLGLVVVLTLAACEVDTDDLAPIDDYLDWTSLETEGELAGHGESDRVIFVNDVALAYPGAGRYAIGSVIVKEIRAYVPGPELGGLRYIAVMRKLGENAPEPPGGRVEGGWLFTQLDALGEPEHRGVSCWRSCHVQAPVDGAWFDYGALGAR